MTLYSNLVTLLIIWVRVSPAATTNMEAMVMTVLLPNVAMAALLSRHPKSTRATMAASAVKDMGILFVKNRTSITTNSSDTDYNR